MHAVELEMFDFDVLYVATDGAKILDDAWLLDSACSFHVCLEKESITTCKLIKGGKCLIGNRIVYKVLEVGTVKIQMHDGVMRMLTSVLHVPG